MDQPEVSTAGCWWYKNAFAVFTPDGNALVIRLGDATIVCIDVVQGCPMEEIPRAFAELAGQQSREIAAKLLESRNAFERETGAIVSGQERISETIPRLRELLNDEAYGTTGIDIRHKTRDYFVRRAAVSALRSMGEAVGNVTVEEPDPPSDDSDFSPFPFPPITPAGPAK
jgi:hypothetical protein